MKTGALTVVRILPPHPSGKTYWECKCGNWSKMADRSRFRYWEKLDKLNAERKINMAAPTTTNKS